MTTEILYGRKELRELAKKLPEGITLAGTSELVARGLFPEKFKVVKPFVTRNVDACYQVINNIGEGEWASVTRHGETVVLRGFDHIWNTSPAQIPEDELWKNVEMVNNDYIRHALMSNIPTFDVFKFYTHLEGTKLRPPYLDRHIEKVLMALHGASDTSKTNFVPIGGAGPLRMNESEGGLDTINISTNMEFSHGSMTITTGSMDYLVLSPSIFLARMRPRPFNPRLAHLEQNPHDFMGAKDFPPAIKPDSGNDISKAELKINPNLISSDGKHQFEIVGTKSSLTDNPNEIKLELTLKLK